MLAMFGVALACLVLGGWALLSLSDGRAGWLLAGSALYLAGTVLVTMAGNVPLNDALAAVDPDSPEGQREWARYLSAWTTWNSVRAAATIAATALLGVGLLQGG